MLNGDGNKHKLEDLIGMLRALGSPEAGEDIPDEPRENHCACPFSAYALAEEWSALVTELLLDPVNIVKTMPAHAHRVSYYAQQMDKHCKLDGLLNRMLSNFGELSVEMLKDDLNSKLPGGIENIDNLSDIEINKVLKEITDTRLLTLSMMMPDARTILRNCTTERY